MSCYASPVRNWLQKYISMDILLDRIKKNSQFYKLTCVRNLTTSRLSVIPKDKARVKFVKLEIKQICKMSTYCNSQLKYYQRFTS